MLVKGATDNQPKAMGLKLTDVCLDQYRGGPANNTLYVRYMEQHAKSVDQFIKSGPRFNMNTVIPAIEISIIKIRRSWDRLIFIIGIILLVRRC